MILFSIICICIVSLLILIGMAGLICFIGVQTESVAWVMVTIMIAFFFAYLVFSLTFAILNDHYQIFTFFTAQ